MEGKPWLPAEVRGFGWDDEEDKKLDSALAASFQWEFAISRLGDCHCHTGSNVCPDSIWLHTSFHHFKSFVNETEPEQWR